MTEGKSISGVRWCWKCRQWRNDDLLGVGEICDVCHYTHASVKLSEKPVYKKRVRYINGISHSKSRYVHSQVKALKCGDCGSRLHIGSDFFCHGLRLVQLNCYGMDAHSYYAFIDLTAKIIAVYRTGSWIEAAGRYQDPDIPF